MKLQFFAALAALVAATAGASEPAARFAPLSYDEARTRLHRLSDGLRMHDAQIAHDDASYEASKSLDGPTVSLSAMQIWGTKTVDMSISNPLSALGPVIGKDNPYLGAVLGQKSFDINFKEDISGPRASLNVFWPIYMGGQISARQEALRLDGVVSRANRDAYVETLDAELAGRYWGAQLARSIEKLRADMLSDEESALHKAERFEKKGLISHLERLAVEVARDAAKRDLASAQTDRRIAEAELQNLLREEKLPELNTPLFVIDGDVGTLSFWQDKTLAQNPQLSSIRAQADKAREGVKAAEGAYLPKVFAFGQKNLVKEYLTLPEPDWVAGVGVNITLWSGIDRRESTRAAQSLVDKAGAADAEARNRLLSAVESAWLRVTNSQSEYRLTQSTLALARENLKLREKAFAQGLATADDVNTARSRLVGAEIARRAAAFKFVTGWAQLHAVAGDMAGFTDSLNRTDLTKLD